MASGVKVNKERMLLFYEQVKMRTKNKRLYTVWKIADDSEVVQDEELDNAGCHSVHELLNKLPKTEGRYIIYDYAFEGKSGAQANKLIMILWCPENISVKQKMLYAASKRALLSILPDELEMFQCDSVDDITDKDIVKKVRK